MTLWQFVLRPSLGALRRKVTGILGFPAIIWPKTKVRREIKDEEKVRSLRSDNYPPSWDNLAKAKQLRRITKCITKTVVNERSEALRIATKDCQICVPKRFVLFTDASALEDKAPSIALTYRPGQAADRWVTKSFSFPKYMSVPSAEACAVIQALAVAAQVVLDNDKDGGKRYNEIVIYSDYSTVVAKLQKAIPENSFVEALVLAKLRTLADQLEMANVRIELHWVPGHATVVGNIIAHERSVAARRTAGRKAAGLRAPRIGSPASAFMIAQSRAAAMYGSKLIRSTTSKDENRS